MSSPNMNLAIFEIDELISAWQVMGNGRVAVQRRLDARAALEKKIAHLAAPQCNYPLCQTEAEQDRIAERTYVELYSGER